MGIGSVTSANSISNMQMITAASTDPKIKNIQNEIADAKQQMQKLSSQEELSASEKMDGRKKLQKEISDLNTKLQQHKDELSKSQRREIMLAELQEDQVPEENEEPEDKIKASETLSYQSDEKNLSADNKQQGTQETVISRGGDGTVLLKEDPSSKETRNVDVSSEQDVQKASAVQEVRSDEDMQEDRKMDAMVSASSSVQQANRQGAVIARTRDGIAILKGEMNLDEIRGTDTDPEKKQAELEKMEKREERAATFQFSILGEANNTMKSAAETNVSGMTSPAQVNAGNDAFLNAMKLSHEGNNLLIGFT